MFIARRTPKIVRPQRGRMFWWYFTHAIAEQYVSLVCVDGQFKELPGLEDCRYITHSPPIQLKLDSSQRIISHSPPIQLKLDVSQRIWEWRWTNNLRMIFNRLGIHANKYAISFLWNKFFLTSPQLQLWGRGKDDQIPGVRQITVVQKYPILAKARRLSHPTLPSS